MSAPAVEKSAQYRVGCDARASNVGRWPGESGVQALKKGTRRIRPPISTGPPLAGISELLGQVSVCQNAYESGGERVRITRWDEQGSLSVWRNFRHRTRRHGDDGKAVRHRLQENDAESF